MVGRGPDAESGVGRARRCGDDPVRMRSNDVEEATSRAGEVFHPHTLTRVDRPGSFTAELEAVSAGPVVTGRLEYNSNSDLHCPAIGGYHVNVPLSGGLISVSAGVRTEVTPAHAVAYESGSDARIVCPEGSRLNIFAMKIDGGVVHSVLADLLERPINRPLRLCGPIDLTAPDGVAWWSMVRDVHQGQVAGSIMANPMMVKPLAYSTIIGLLMLAEHDYSTALRDPAPPAASAVIGKAAEFVEANADQPLTPTDIAATVGISVRSLQRGFREQYGCTPAEFVRSVRLRRAHDALVAASPESTSVAAVASSWGFCHLGRFAAEYRRTYGVSPSQSLRHDQP